MDSRKIDWLSTKPSKERLIVGAAVIGLLAVGYAVGRGDSGGNASIATANAAASGRLAPNGFVQPGAQPAPMAANASGSGPVPLSPLSSGPCSTFAPEGWQVTDKNNEGTIFTTQSADKRQIAAYAGMAINGGSAAGAYGPQFRSPEAATLYIVSQMTGEDTQTDGAEEPVGSYQAMHFKSATHSGYVLIYRFSLPADPAGYGMILRVAVGNSDAKSLGIAGSVMAATRCQSSLRPPPQGMAEYHARTDDHGAGSSDQGDDVTMAGTYNSQLGTGWVHDSTGRNYNVSVTDDWRNGPEGEGFYGPNGEKLQSGLQ